MMDLAQASKQAAEVQAYVHFFMMGSEPALKLGQKSQTFTNHTQGRRQKPA